ncbi:MAG: hypothetical protein HQL38_06620 [Alphaproteobacteria bacterium]|nr:hypothetical protein [Alphaproteobacteria bacterium]
MIGTVGGNGRIVWRSTVDVTAAKAQTPKTAETQARPKAGEPTRPKEDDPLTAATKAFKKDNAELLKNLDDLRKKKPLAQAANERMARVKERVLALKQLVKQALAAGNKTMLKSLAREIAQLGRELAIAARDMKEAARAGAMDEEKAAKNGKADAATGAKAEAATGAKAEAATGAEADGKTDGNADAKTDGNADAKTDAKTDAKVDAKVDAKTDAKVDAKTDAKAATVNAAGIALRDQALAIGATIGAPSGGIEVPRSTGAAYDAFEVDMRVAAKELKKMMQDIRDLFEATGDDKEKKDIRKLAKELKKDLEQMSDDLDLGRAGTMGVPDVAVRGPVSILV